MEWLAEWVKNLAVYFIFLSALLHFLPEGEERKYIRFYMGILLILLILRPFLQIGDWDRQLEKAVLSDSLEEEFEEMMRETKRQEVAGTDYVKKACERELEQQLEQLTENCGYELVSSRIIFFEGEELELQDISLWVKKEGEAAEGDEKFLKSRLEEVYNIPEGNINISIQG